MCQRLRKEISVVHDLDISADLCKKCNKLKKRKKHAFKKQQIIDINKMCITNNIDFWKKFRDITRRNYRVLLDPVVVYKKQVPLSMPPEKDYFNYDLESEAAAFVGQFCKEDLVIAHNKIEILNIQLHWRR